MQCESCSDGGSEGSWTFGGRGTWVAASVRACEGCSEGGSEGGSDCEKGFVRLGGGAVKATLMRDLACSDFA